MTRTRTHGFYYRKMSLLPRRAAFETHFIADFSNGLYPFQPMLDTDWAQHERTNERMSSENTFFLSILVSSLSGRRASSAMDESDGLCGLFFAYLLSSVFATFRRVVVVVVVANFWLFTKWFEAEHELRTSAKWMKLYNRRSSVDDLPKCQCGIRTPKIANHFANILYSFASTTQRKNVNTHRRSWTNKHTLTVAHTRSHARAVQWVCL